MKKSRPFAFKIVAAEFFAAVHKIPLKRRGEFITQFVTDLVTLEPVTEYGTQVVGETIDFIKKQSEFGKSGGKPKHRHPIGTLEAPFTEPIGTPYPEVELEVKEEIKEKPKDLKPTPLKSQMFEICKAWKAFIEMRKFIRKPLTNYAMDLTCKTLEKLHREGHDPIAVLNKSVEHNWQGVFPLKDDEPSKADQPAELKFGDPGYKTDQRKLAL